MIDPVSVGREWGRTFPDIWRPDEEIAREALDRFWERSKHAIDRQSWPWRRPLRITWYLLLIAMFALFIYAQFLSSFVNRGGAAARAATADLNVVAWFFGTFALILTLVGCLRLVHYFFNGIPLIKQARSTWADRAAEAGTAAIAMRRGLTSRRRKYPAPARQPFGITPSAAPALIREWMRHLGEEDVELLDFSRTGVHLGSTNYVARVWYQSTPVPASDMKDLAAAAFMHHRKPLAFTTGAYELETHKLADGRMALFLFSAEQGTLTPINAVARSILAP